MIKTIDPNDRSLGEVHSLLLGSVAPRPIAFASTVDKNGEVNLSPFSYFNCFSANPPILVFSPARRGRDNTTKHTYENVLEVPEVVINMVSYDIVEQMSLSSTEYPKDVDEFVKSGLSPVPSEKVKPPRVGESPVAFECRVNDVVALGKEGGAGNLIICEVVLMHFREDVFDDRGNLDPNKLDLVARMGGNWYSRARGDALFEIPKPLRTMGVGVDQLPQPVRDSRLFSGNELGRLGNVEKLPEMGEIKALRSEKGISEILTLKDISQRRSMLFKLAKEALEKEEIERAWKIILLENQNFSK